MFNFPGQRENEKILSVVRKHQIVYAKIMAAFILSVIFPLTILLAFWFRLYPAAEYSMAASIVLIFVSLILLYGLLFTCIRWINEEFDIFIITTDRLIDVTQISFLVRSVTSTPLEQIQDTTGTVSGFIPTILHYGDLKVQTAGSQASDIFIDHVYNPEDAAREILDWAHKKRSRKIIRRGQE